MSGSFGYGEAAFGGNMEFFDEIEEREFSDEFEEPESEWESEDSETGPPFVHPQLGIGLPVSSELEFEDREDQEEEIIGSSDSRSPVRNTTKAPYRFVCRLEMIFQDPGWNGGVAMKFAGTGTLISPRHVLTAGHNIRSIFGGKALTAKSVTASPGQDRDKKPFGTCKVTGFKAKNEWMNDQNACHDYALLTLEKDMGSLKFKAIGNKPLGYWGDFEKGNDTRLEFVDPDKLKKSTVRVVGYAGDKCGYLPIEKYKKGAVCTYTPSGTVSKGLQDCLKAGLHASAQFGAKGKMLDPLPAGGGSFLFAYDADTCKGHSGSPVWAENKGLLYLIGVHTGPWSIAKGSCADVVPAGAATDANRAVRVTTNMLDNIRKWKA
ncbi:MAG TPA: hypothetical protein VG937_15860 [Polyangiaceae bacterium]|nr:hypothetical protein [Polyangiaceae bacterium]